MKELIIHTITVFMGFFAIMNPIANTPIFLGLTGDNDRETVKSIAFRSVFIAFIIVSTFAISGKLIFDLFGITLYALRITGGILVFLIGFRPRPPSLRSLNRIGASCFGEFILNSWPASSNTSPFKTSNTRTH